MEEEYGREQARVELGLIGNPNDVPEQNVDIVSYLDEIDEAFRKDFGFGLRDLVNVQQILSLWPAYNKRYSERTYYIASDNEMEEICSVNIMGVDKGAIKPIIDFLTLKSEELLFIVGKDSKEKDLPVWEHRKRTTRYTIKPLIKIGTQYLWGPYSVERSGHIWANVSASNKLPPDFRAENAEKVLKKGHLSLGKSLEAKTEEVVKRFTPFVPRGVYPHKLDNNTTNIGDCDVLAFLKDKNILLNIEAKLINPAFV